MSSYVSPTSGRRRLFFYLGALSLLLLVTAGIFASNGWFPSTDSISGKHTGWFGKPLAKNAPDSWNPITPDPTPPPLSKEYIYAGSRLLAVEDSLASAVPPADLAIWRSSSGQWWILNGTANGSYSTYSAGTWGSGGDPNGTPPVPPDKPEPGDYDGDGKTDFCVFRPSTGTWWIIESSSANTYNFTFGNATDIPAPGDYDGDGKTDAAFFRSDPSTGLGTFNIRRYDGTFYAAQFGLSTDTPKSADFDGDGKADLGVWRSSTSTYYSLNSSNSSVGSFTFLDQSNPPQPISSTEPVPADYDGDGKADYAIRQSGSSNWVIRDSRSGTTDVISWQSSGDIAVQNDYDGDGKCDIAVWHAATGYWYIRPSANTNTTRSVQWGAYGDQPVPAYFRR